MVFYSDDLQIAHWSIYRDLILPIYGCCLGRNLIRKKFLLAGVCIADALGLRRSTLGTKIAIGRAEAGERSLDAL